MGLIAFIKRFINSDFKKPLNKLIEETYGEISDDLLEHEANIATASDYGHIRLANSNVTTAGLKRAIPHEYITVANLANATINLNDYRLTHDYTIYLASGQTLQNFPSGWTASNANSAYLEVRMFYTSAGKQTLHKRGTLEVWERYFTSATAFGAWMKVGGG